MYDNAFDNNYEELKTYYPVWYREIKEMDALWQVNGRQLDQIQEGIVEFLLNSVVATADSQAVARWEKFLYITYDGPRTLEERRTMVQSFFLGNGHIGEQEIKEIICAFTNGEIIVDLIGGVIEVSVTRDISERFKLSDCLFILYKRIPAHLGLGFTDIFLPISFITTGEFRLKAVQFITSLNNIGNGVDGFVFQQLYMAMLLERTKSTTALKDLGFLPTPFINENRFIIDKAQFLFSIYNYVNELVCLNGQEKLDGTYCLDQWRKSSLYFEKLNISTSFQTNGFVGGGGVFDFYAALFENENKFRHFMNLFLMSLNNIKEADGLGLRVFQFNMDNKNKFHGTELEDLTLQFLAYSNKCCGTIDTLKFQSSTKTENSFDIPLIGYSLQVKTNNQLNNEGTLLHDSMYWLDGEVLMDGSRKLNADRIEEVI